MRKTIVGMGVTMVLAAAPAMAQESAGKAPAANAEAANTASAFFLEQFDADKDGKVGWDQFVAFRKQRYADTDENKNGSVDVEEYTNEYLTRLDGRIESERKAQVEQTRVRVKALDTDQDGFISRAEYDASGERAFAHFEKTFDKPEPASTRRSALDMPSTHTRAGMLEIYDANADGKVTRAEYDQGRAAAFARTDQDGDGKLSGDEYLAEFEDRLDRRAASTRESSAAQAKVRFKSLDADKDGRITWDEYHVSGTRMFERTDTNGDRIVDARDPAPAKVDAHDAPTPAATTPAPSATR